MGFLGVVGPAAAVPTHPLGPGVWPSSRYGGSGVAGSPWRRARLCFSDSVHDLGILPHLVWQPEEQTRYGLLPPFYSWGDRELELS